MDDNGPFSVSPSLCAFSTYSIYLFMSEPRRGPQKASGRICLWFHLKSAHFYLSPKKSGLSAKQLELRHELPAPSLNPNQPKDSCETWNLKLCGTCRMLPGRMRRYIILKRCICPAGSSKTRWSSVRERLSSSSLHTHRHSRAKVL